MGRGKKVLEFTSPQVSVPLSEVDRGIKANELAQLCGEIDTLKANAAEAASSERKKIRALEKRRRVVAECVRTGTEMVDAQRKIFPEDEKRARSNGHGGGGVDA